MERRRQNTIAQLTALVDYLEQNNELALGRVRSKEARAASARLWEEVSFMLNSEGPARTGKEWAKVWNDLKSRVRAKLVAINTSHQSPGGCPNISLLTPLEDRVAQILERDVWPSPNEAHNEESKLFQFIEGRNTVPDSDKFYVVSVNADDDIHKYAALANAASPEPEPVEPQAQEGATSPALDSEASSPIPCTTGQTPQSSGTRGRMRRVGQGQRQRVKHTAVRRTRPAQSDRSALEESRLMILKIEKMKAEASLITAQGFKLLAESVDRFTRQFTRQGEAASTD